MNFQKLSDKELYALCKEYGVKARIWRRRFAGLLPEVLKRRLYKKRGYTSIHEFAGKLAGMSKESVNKVLRLSKKLEDKPFLKDQFESGSQGWSKLEKVAYIATPETDKDWAEKLENMSCLAIDGFVHELRMGRVIGQNNRLGFTDIGEIQPEKTAVLTFRLQPELEGRFRMYKHLLEKERKEPLTFEDVLENLLNRNCPSCLENRLLIPEMQD